jgi:hypothetical protein
MKDTGVSRQVYITHVQEIQPESGQHSFVNCVSRSEPQSEDGVQLEHHDTEPFDVRAYTLLGTFLCFRITFALPAAR